MDTNFISIEQYQHFSLGRIALTRGLITAQQILESIKLQHNDPNKKIGEILVQIEAITLYQIQEILAFQKNLFAKIASWKYPPDSILKGHVYFSQEIFTYITPSQIQASEESSNQSFLATNKIIPLAKVLLADLPKEALGEMNKISSELKFYLYECPCCKRFFRLFDNKEKREVIYCPVCWSIELVQTKQGQNFKEVSLETLQHSFQPKSDANLKRLETPVEKIIIPHQSPGFILTYEVLKRMEPTHREGMTRKFSTDCRTIKLVFGDIAEQFLEYENVEKIEPTKTLSDELSQTKDSTPEEKIATELPQENNSFEYMGQKIEGLSEESKRHQVRMFTKNSLKKSQNKTVLHAQSHANIFIKSVLLGFLSILIYFMLGIIFDNPKTQTNTQIITTQNSEYSNTKKTNNIADTPSPVENMPTIAQNLPEPSPNTTPTVTKLSQTIVLDSVAERKIKIICNKFPKLMELLLLDVQNFLKTKDITTFQNAKFSWLDMWNHYIIKHLPEREGQYESSEILKKVEQIHLLSKNIEQIVNSISQYIESKDRKISEESIATFVKNANVASMIIESSQLFLELSNKKENIFEAFLTK